VPIRPIGAHAKVTGGLATGSLRYAAAVGAEAIQVFVSNPRGWAPSNGDAGQDAALREHVAATGLPVFVHAPYLINVGSPDLPTLERSVAAIRCSLRRGREIGARGVVVHTGSAVGGDREAALARVRESLLPLLDEIGDEGPDLLLEPMAGQGQMLCAALAQLEPYLDRLDWHPRANVCLDTCHAFAAGHDLATARGTAAAMRALQDATRDPGGRLRLVHANDSKDGRGSCRDRHENIGAGQIGTAGFGRLLHHPVTDGVPFVVETPGGQSGHARDIATLLALQDGG
jgi:deoxyribonuclease-4